MGESIEIVIKAANGSVDDFKMSAQANWTVTQVKNHIYRHYPTHPPLSSQRLIHSGRMLLDQQTLLEALSDLSNIIQPVIIHLVAYQRSVSAPAMSQTTSSSGSRTQATSRSRTQRQVSGSGQRTLSPIREAAGGGVAEMERGGVAPPVNDNQSQLPQQMPAHQQPQNPWLRHRGSGGYHFQHQNVQGQLFMPMAAGFPPQMAGGFPAQMAGGFPAQMAGAVPAQMAGGVPTQFPQFYHPFGAPYLGNQQMAQYWNYYNQYPREPVATGEAMTGEGGEIVEDLDLNNLQDLVANNPDLDEQDVPMNAGGLGMMAGGAAQFRRHRDIVDYLYMLTMMMFLALIAYVTGSFGRLMVFAGGILFMMLNQRGWFSLQRRRPARQREERAEVNPLERVGQQQQQEEEEREREERGEEGETAQENSEETRREEEEGTDRGEMMEEPRPTDMDRGSSQPSSMSSNQTAPQEGTNEGEGEGEGEEQGGVVREDHETSPSPLQLPEEQPAQQPRPGILTTILIFVTSFFTSLVPQQRPELQFN